MTALSAHHSLPTIFDVDLPVIENYDGPDPEEAHRNIRAAHARAPMALGAYCPELLDYELVRAVLRDARFVPPKGMALVFQGITSGPVWDRVTRLLINMDGHEHQRLRRLVAKAFTPRAADRMRAACVDTINELVDTIAPLGRCDVVADIAERYPVPIICDLLGVPREDWPLFIRWAPSINKAMMFGVAEAQAEILGAFDELDGYLDELIARRRHTLTDDLISQLIRAEMDGDKLNNEELRDLVLLLLNAGTDTTRNQLAAAVYVFADHPRQWALLGEHPELANNAVEEAIRHSPVINGVVRVASEDAELGGVVIPEGTIVIAKTAAANRDPAVYAEPERFDITRCDRSPMQTFGGGVHHCLGVHLARVELAEAIAVMARRMPNLRRTGPAPWKPLASLSGPVTLPVMFDADR
jgi:cytochrome P450